MIYRFISLYSLQLGSSLQSTGIQQPVKLISIPDPPLDVIAQDRQRRLITQQPNTPIIIKEVSGSYANHDQTSEIKSLDELKQIFEETINIVEDPEQGTSLDGDEQEIECISLDDSDDEQISPNQSLSSSPSTSNSATTKQNTGVLHQFLQSHYKNSNTVVFKCKKCAAKFNKLFSLLTHMKIHYEGSNIKLAAKKGGTPKIIITPIKPAQVTSPASNQIVAKTRVVPLISALSGSSVTPTLKVTPGTKNDPKLHRVQRLPGTSEVYKPFGDYRSPWLSTTSEPPKVILGSSREKTFTKISIVPDSLKSSTVLPTVRTSKAPETTSTSTNFPSFKVSHVTSLAKASASASTPVALKASSSAPPTINSLGKVVLMKCKTMSGQDLSLRVRKFSPGSTIPKITEPYIKIVPDALGTAKPNVLPNPPTNTKSFKFRFDEHGRPKIVTNSAQPSTSQTSPTKLPTTASAKSSPLANLSPKPGPSSTENKQILVLSKNSKQEISVRKINLSENSDEKTLASAKTTDDTSDKVVSVDEMPLVQEAGVLKNIEQIENATVCVFCFDTKGDRCAKLAPFACNHCDRTFKHMSSANTHRSLYINQLQNTCRICGKILSCRSLRIEHEKQHDKDVREQAYTERMKVLKQKNLKITTEATKTMAEKTAAEKNTDTELISLTDDEEIEVELEVKPEPKLEPEPELDSDLESETEPKPESEPEQESDPEPKQKSEAEPETSIKPTEEKTSTEPINVGGDDEVSAEPTKIIEKDTSTESATAGATEANKQEMPHEPVKIAEETVSENKEEAEKKSDEDKPSDIICIED